MHPTPPLQRRLRASALPTRTKAAQRGAPAAAQRSAQPFARAFVLAASRNALPQESIPVPLGAELTVAY